MGKRKGDDVLVGTQPTVATVGAGGSPAAAAVGGSTAYYHSSPTLTATGVTNMTTATATTTTNHRSQPAWLDSASFDHKLWVVRESLKLDDDDILHHAANNNNNAVDNEEEQKDDFLKEVQQCQDTIQSFRLQQEEMIQTSLHIQNNLTLKISGEEDKCQEESEHAHSLEQIVKKIVQERDSIAADVSDLDRMRTNLQERIGIAIEEANQQVESIDMVEEARKNQVPKLKHQISMYATTTGIKWDFENERLLEGHVSIPSKEVVRSFSIDPEEHSQYEIASQLWSVMDTSNLA